MEQIIETSIAIGGELAADRRAERRQRVLKGAVLRFNKGYGALECLVRNRSRGGARLEFGDTAAVPPHFDIRFSGSDEWSAASVRWRDMTNVGVELTRE